MKGYASVNFFLILISNSSACRPFCKRWCLAWRRTSFKKSTPGQLVDVVDTSTVLGASKSLSLQKCEINKASMIPQNFQELILILILFTDVDLKFSASMALSDTFRSSRFACFSRGSRTLRLRRCVDFRRTGWSADD